MRLCLAGEEVALCWLFPAIAVGTQVVLSYRVGRSCKGGVGGGWLGRGRGVNGTVLHIARQQVTYVQEAVKQQDAITQV